MPKRRTTRDRVRRKLQQAQGNIGSAQAYISDFIIPYSDSHPDLAIQGVLINEALDEIIKGIDRLIEQF